MTRLLKTPIIGRSATTVVSSWIDMLAGLSMMYWRRMPPDFCAAAGEAMPIASKVSVAPMYACTDRAMFPPRPAQPLVLPGFSPYSRVSRVRPASSEREPSTPQSARGNPDFRRSRECNGGRPASFGLIAGRTCVAITGAEAPRCGDDQRSDRIRIVQERPVRDRRRDGVDRV